MTCFAIQRVKATPAALELIERTEREARSRLLLSVRRLLRRERTDVPEKGELLPTPNDTKIGEIGGSPFYVDDEQYERWGRPAFLIDVAPGAAGGFSLEGLEEVHFVTRTPDHSEVFEK